MERHETHRGDAGWGSPAPRLTPDDIQRKEFRSARLRVGYVMEEVDEFLDQVTDTLTALLAENERLRAQGSDRPAGPAADPTATASSEPVVVAPAPSDAADRAAVEAFIQREKAFLQSLGALVQEHAEALKGMVRSARSPARAETPPAIEPPAAARDEEEPEASTTATAGRPEVAAAATEAPPPADEGEAAAWVPGFETAETAAPVDREDGGADEEPDDASADADTGEVTAVTEEPIRVDEPEPARSRREDRSSDGSLRELFWGEE